MRALGRWLFGDIASVVAPRIDRGPRRAPTRRSARRLIGIGLFVTLFGAIGYAGEAGAKLDRQPATVLGRYTTQMRATGSTSTIHEVRLQLEGHRYPTGRQSAAVVVTLIVLACGVFLLLRGIGRHRRARFAAAPPAPNTSPADGFQFFGHVEIDAESRVMSVSLRDLDGKVLHTADLDPGHG